MVGLRCPEQLRKGRPAWIVVWKLGRPWTKIFFTFMNLRFFFFLALLKICLSSSPNESTVAPKEEVFSYFSQLLPKINQSPSLSINFDDYDKIKGLYRRFPLDCMLSLKALNKIKLVYLTCLIIENYDYYEFLADLEKNPFGMNQKSHFKATVRRIFKCFNLQIIFKLREQFTCADSEDWKEEWKDINVEWNDRKKLVCTMLSILQRLGFSTKSFLDSNFCYVRKISPRTCIRVMANLIEDIEMDFVAGAYKTFLRLQHLSKSHAGKIPTQEPLQQKIFTLVNLFHIYSYQIINFSPTSLNLDLCTPEFLALLVMSSRYATWEEIFSFFISDNVICNLQRKNYALPTLIPFFKNMN